MRRLEVTCPACSPEVPVLHEVLKEDRGGGGEEIYVEATVECGECGSVHRTEMRIPKPVEVEVVVSRGEESETESLELFPDSVVEVGEELEGREVTSIETGEGRVEEAEVSEVETLWTRDVETVEVPFSIHVGRETESDTMEMDGEEEVEVGDKFRRGGLLFTVDDILTRGGRKVEEAEAKEIKRLYASTGR